MGRRKKVLTEDTKRRRVEAGKRIDVSRKSHGLTIVDLAEKLNVCETSLRNYIHARQDVPEDIAKNLQCLFGYTYLYWQGEPDAETWDAYMASQETAESEALAEWQKEQERIMSVRETFFEMLGFKDKDKSDHPVFMFSSVSTDDSEFGKAARADAVHQLTNIQNEDERWYLKESEFAALLDSLKDVMRFQCFKVNRGTMAHK